jgi:hypothetical protein
MLRTSRPARGRNRAGIGSAFALAIALASATAATPALAQAPAAQAQANYKPSRGFGKVYEPIATIANAEAGDFAAARGKLPALIAAIENEDDRYLAGNVHFTLGLKLRDRALQQQGMELMLASGKATPQAAAEMNYYLGEWAYDAQQWARARQFLQAARAGGYTQGNAIGLTAESYFQEGQVQQGLAFLEGEIEQRRTAGQQPPEAWLRRGQSIAYEKRDAALAAKWSALLASEYPTVDNWRRAWLIVEELHAPDPKARLDLFRLMTLTNAMNDRAGFGRYLDAVDPRIMATEAGRVLAAARTAGAFTEADPDYVRIKTVVDERAPGEPAEAARYAAEATRAANGRPAENAGDLYLALEDFAKAEEMFQLALTKGGIDRDAVLTRLGIAQARSGKYAEAKATFGQVAGTRASIAQLWTAYVDSKA